MNNSFFGWYFKTQSSSTTLAVIPAVHTFRQEQTCSIQLLTEDGAWQVTYPGSAFRREKEGIRVGNSWFGPEGLSLNVEEPSLQAAGELSFGPLTPLRYPIMGPFRFLPFLECQHSVQSMAHSVSGNVILQGKHLDFSNAAGYWEGDQGRSFPRNYAWTQCHFDGGSLMLSVAEVPIGRFRFTGVIGAVVCQGREYRLATYLGARAVRIQDRTLVVRQGSSCLSAQLLETRPWNLAAPRQGNMARTIRECPACRAQYQFQTQSRTLFDFQTDQAAFEYEYPR